MAPTTEALYGHRAGREAASGVLRDEHPHPGMLILR